MVGADRGRDESRQAQARLVTDMNEIRMEAGEQDRREQPQTRHSLGQGVDIAAGNEAFGKEMREDVVG